LQREIVDNEGCYTVRNFMIFSLSSIVRKLNEERRKQELFISCRNRKCTQNSVEMSEETATWKTEKKITGRFKTVILRGTGCENLNWIKIIQN
jgi:hypothetical protein